MKFRTAVLICVSVIAATGCDLGTYAERVASAGTEYVPPVKTVSVSEADEGSSSKPLPGEGSPALGDWEMNKQASIELTRKVFRPVPSQPGLKLENVEAAINEMEFTFSVKPDMTFIAMTSARSQSFRHRGKWKLTRDKIEFNQTHTNNKPEKDYLPGTLAGDRIDGTLEKRGFKMGVVLDRVR